MGNNGSWISMIVCVAVLAVTVLRVPLSADPVEMQANLRHALPAVFFRSASTTLLGSSQSQ